MKIEKLELPNYTGGQAELIIREGKASEPFNPTPLKLSGTIEAPVRWLKMQIALIYVAVNTLVAHVLVNRDAGTIVLAANHDTPGFTEVEITGSVELHPDFIKFGINSGTQLAPHDLAEFIKMNRSCFADKTVAMTLVKDLRTFKAKVDKELEAFKDDRANYSIKKSQTVDTNLPPSFKLLVPIYKGRPKESFEVEININADNLMCSLISPEANDFIADFKDKIIDEQIKAIEEIAPNMVIIEQ